MYVNYKATHQKPEKMIHSYEGIKKYERRKKIINKNIHFP